ncbi:helix turn helix arsenical resistance operon repressor [Trichococcus palustris]|jgi:ArsR family transcriptional regulator, arsenate/arsenite/antimonite-responsive transcriptional repressor|uniref:Helix turn helix arsenical resistance operon repressor n=1 Tax=Trichococcus palustris TaxID=140314 RepID=A0A143YSW3_9LACT|nr:metalloregulator ArsR/SmtB family transcription factor [Trichococcus palustris]CZQ97846.1 helix turn helix arsenical resistance operon repressor [Trichococcus palustris]SFL10540.1 transcriptional regulator, ArsR family [Trichococcus palustris]
MEQNYKAYAKSLKVLSDETRLKIMDLLGEGELCACELLEEFSITQPTLSYHMKMLCDSGLVVSRKDGSMVKYTLNHDSLDDLKAFFKHMASGMLV